jgi:monovalent cation:H+ antiporter, CPA1 family
MDNATVFILLFIIATAVAIGVRRFHIPYTVALVLAGLILGLAHLLQPPHLTKNLLFTVFLPGLLFEAAFHLDFQQFWRNRVTIVSLAVPGVVAAIALTTLILTPVANILPSVKNFSWKYALVFGALIAATDPIAVVAVFKKLGAPRRLSMIMEGESLINDGTGIVFFTLSLSLVAGTQVSVIGLGVSFVSIVGVGIIIGSAVGLMASQIIKRVDDAMIQITLTTLAAYGSFMVAEQLHYSGVIATVTAGLFCGNYGSQIGMTPSSRIAIESFWEYVAFALNSIVFLLIGFEVHIKALLVSWQIILVAYLAVGLGRTAVVLGVSSLLRLTRERLPWSWTAILWWGGLRGALPMVLVLSLPGNFPHRDLLVTTTFGVVLLSILIQGISMSPLLRWLGIVKWQEGRQALELARGRLLAAYAGQEALEHMATGRLRISNALPNLRQEYEKKIKAIEQELGEMAEPDLNQIADQEMRWARRHLLLVEKNRVIDAFQEGRLSQRVYEKLLEDLDARLLQVETEL